MHEPRTWNPGDSHRLPLADGQLPVTGQADPEWLTAAITAARQPRARARRGEDIIETAIRAALPAIESGLREQIAQEIRQHPYADDDAHFARGVRMAAEIVLSDPCQHESLYGDRCMGCGVRGQS